MTWFVPLDIGITVGLIFSFAVVAFGLSFRLLNFPDLTVEGSIPLGASVFAILLKSGAPFPLAVLAALLAGGLAGALTAIIHVRFRLNKFLAGIIVIAISYSLCLRIMGASNIGLLQLTSIFDPVQGFERAVSEYFQLGKILLLSLLLLLCVGVLFFGLSTLKGIRLRTAGSNPEFARSLGINVPTNIIIGLALTNALAAFSGVLLATYQGFTDVNMGAGTLLLALAALTIGERLLSERRLSFPSFVLAAAVIGSLVYQVVVAYAVRFGLASTDLKLVTAVLVLIVVAFRVSQDGELLSETPK
ncbi:MAG: inner-rane translocator [Bacteroidetes bacterium]|nr:inner-rane translocator [Bacteroidota bacterium]